MPLLRTKALVETVLCLLGLLAASLCNAFASQDETEAAPRATSLMADYKGQLRPVVGVKWDRAQVMVDGAFETLPTPNFFLEPL